MKFLSWFLIPRPTYTLTVQPFGDGWGFHAKAGNGEIVFHGEGHPDKYEAKQAALRACRAKLVFKETLTP